MSIREVPLSRGVPTEPAKGTEVRCARCGSVYMLRPGQALRNAPICRCLVDYGHAEPTVSLPPDAESVAGPEGS